MNRYKLLQCVQQAKRFTSFQSSSCASDSTAHKRWTVRPPETQTLQNPPGRRRWCPGPSWFYQPQRGPSETETSTGCITDRVAGHLTTLSTRSYLQEVGQLVLHQLPEIPPAEGAAPTLFGGVTVEHFDEWLHCYLQFWGHVVWLQTTFKRWNNIMDSMVDNSEFSFLGGGSSGKMSIKCQHILVMSLLCR